jgi:nucleotide-binding universal stress UspA family protein
MTAESSITPFPSIASVALAAPFPSILCAVNGSRGSHVAVEQALALAGTDGAVHFVAFSDERGEGAMRMARVGSKRAEQALLDARRAAREHGVAATTEHLSRPDSRHGLLEAARDHDLLVLGTHGHSRAEGILLGSTAAFALHKSQGPVLVARPAPPGHRPGDRVILASDGSAGDRALAEVAAAIAGRDNGSVTLLHVQGTATPGIRRELAQEATDVFALTGTEPVVVTVHGQPAPTIVSAAAELEATLVVLGSRGLEGVRALGSVSERVGARAHCSVLVLRGR